MDSDKIQEIVKISEKLISVTFSIPDSRRTKTIVLNVDTASELILELDDRMNVAKGVFK